MGEAILARENIFRSNKSLFNKPYPFIWFEHAILHWNWCFYSCWWSLQRFKSPGFFIAFNATEILVRELTSSEGREHSSGWWWTQTTFAPYIPTFINIRWTNWRNSVYHPNNLPMRSQECSTKNWNYIKKREKNMDCNWLASRKWGAWLMLCSFRFLWYNKYLYNCEKSPDSICIISNVKSG